MPYRFIVKGEVVYDERLVHNWKDAKHRAIRLSNEMGAEVIICLHDPEDESVFIPRGFVYPGGIIFRSQMKLGPLRGKDDAEE